MQVANYRQLKNAVAFLRENGCEFVDLPGELSPGIEYCAYVVDPAGHAVQLYFNMEQIGWDGLVRAKRVRQSEFALWPEVLDSLPDTYMGETYPGPWG